MGAGVIPFSVHDNKVYFLFQTVFSGRKTGFYIDFGGGQNQGESYQATAAREFIEETETMFFSQDPAEIKTARRTPSRINRHLELMNHYFYQTLTVYPHWWCRREPGNKIPPKDWKTFFIEVPFRELDAFNKEWEIEDKKESRFKKKRRLHWLEADELLALYDQDAEKLWKRVRQLINARQVIHNIKQVKLQSG
jgi:8-oxo-dGTP pyrophosphatase MutT (NUDIX family)